MAKKHADIIHCLRCGRIKAWDEDCSYLGCNPELHWQEATAVEVYSALHPEGVERERLRGEVETLREALVALRQARDLEIETSQSWRTDRAWREGWAKVDAALAAVPADARGEKALTAAGSCPLLGKCGYEDEDGNWMGHGIWRDRAACQEECRKLVPAAEEE
jgi:hypothetical protein